MRKTIIGIGCFLFSQIAIAQYDAAAINYGLSIGKGFGLQSEYTAGARVEYAYNCFNTFIWEYNRALEIGDSNGYSGHNEFGFSLNLILFNWYPTTITAGMGYVLNDSKIFKDIEEEALLSFRTGKYNHGAQIKIRALYRLSKSSHLFAEVNAKTLGRRYDTFLVGYSYDFKGY